MHLYYVKENKEYCKKLTESWQKFKEPRAQKIVTDFLHRWDLYVDTVVENMDWQSVLNDEDDEVQQLMSSLLGSTD